MKGHVFPFEDIDDALPFVPLAGRRALDAAGAKLPLEAWRALPLGARRAVVDAGGSDAVDVTSVRAAIANASPPATPVASTVEPRDLPDTVVAALGAARPLEASRWSSLSPLARYALWKSADKPGKLARAYDEIVGGSITLAHVNAQGEARMVDVAAKPPTPRRAVASARVRMAPAVLARIVAGEAAKGDVLAAARIAGIQAAKKTPELIPLCHGVALTRVEVSFKEDVPAGVVDVTATAEAIDRTGVEMEALVAASVAALTIYDMVKSADRWMTIERVQLDAKSGGRSGTLTRAQ